MERYAARSTGVLHQIVDVACTAGELSLTMQQQTLMLDDVECKMRDLDSANSTIATYAMESGQIATTASEEITHSIAVIRSSVTGVGELLDAIASGRNILASLEGVLQRVAEGTRGVERVAREIRLLGLNAAIEAARVGVAGKGFAVVANEVKTLAEQSEKVTKDVTSTIKTIENQCRELMNQSTATSALATSVRSQTGGISVALDSVEKTVRSVVGSASNISAAADSIGAKSASLVDIFSAFRGSLDMSRANVQRIEARVSDVQLAGEALVEINVESGVSTEDTIFVSEAMKLAERVSCALNDAVDGYLDLQDVFDRSYIPVPGTSPEQFETRYVDAFDRLIVPILDAALSFDSRIIVCALTDENGFVPTINSKYAQRPTADATWNAANCRNRRIYQDRVGQSAARNRAPYLVQTYLRDMGGGRFAPMAHVSCPITVASRQWGNLRYCYALAHKTPEH